MKKLLCEFNAKLTFTYVINYLYVCLLKLKLNKLICYKRKNKYINKQVIDINKRLNKAIYTMELIEQVV